MSNEPKRPMYTSYFANWRNYPPDKFQAIAIVRTTPKYVHYMNIVELAPPKKMKHLPPESLAIAYRKYLNNNRDAKGICMQIAKICGDKIPVLLCYEKPHEFCHRHILREWLIAERDVDITELGGIPNVQIKLEL